jgi:hypothetical protein
VLLRWPAGGAKAEQAWAPHPDPDRAKAREGRGLRSNKAFEVPGLQGFLGWTGWWPPPHGSGQVLVTRVLQGKRAWDFRGGISSGIAPRNHAQDSSWKAQC